MTLTIFPVLMMALATVYASLYRSEAIFRGGAPPIGSSESSLN